MQKPTDNECHCVDLRDYCQTCGGDGFVEANELHGDWINYSPDECEVCPDCQGTGLEPMRHEPDCPLLRKPER